MTGTEPRRRILPALAAIIVLQALAVGLYFNVEGNRGAEEESSFRFERVEGVPMLPQIDLLRLDGSVLHTGELRDQVVLLHFWATWCPPCREELPSLLRLAREYPGLQVVALALDDDGSNVQQFFGGEVPPGVFRDPSGILAKHYGVGTLPDTYLLDTSGTAKVRLSGARNWSSQGARDVLTRLEE